MPCIIHHDQMYNMLTCHASCSIDTVDSCYFDHQGPDWCLIHLWLNQLDWIKQNLLNQKGLIHRQDCLIHKPWLNQTHWESGLIESKKLMIHELKKIEVNEHGSLSTNINSYCQALHDNKKNTTNTIVSLIVFANPVQLNFGSQKNKHHTASWGVPRQIDKCPAPSYFIFCLTRDRLGGRIRPPSVFL